MQVNKTLNHGAHNQQICKPQYLINGIRKNNFYKNGFIQSCSHGTICTVHSLLPATVYSNSTCKISVTKVMENMSLSVFHFAWVPIYGRLASPVQRTRNHIICNIPYLMTVSSCKSQETIAFYQVLLCNHTDYSQKTKISKLHFLVGFFRSVSANL
jgi:hypothetical protein